MRFLIKSEWAAVLRKVMRRRKERRSARGIGPDTDKSEQLESCLQRDGNGFDCKERWFVWLAALLRKADQGKTIIEEVGSRKTKEERIRNWRGNLVEWRDGER